MTIIFNQDENGGLDSVVERQHRLREMVCADDAWSNELHRVYGQDAGDARYDHRGTATPTLARLHAAFSANQTAYHDRKATS